MILVKKKQITVFKFCIVIADPEYNFVNVTVRRLYFFIAGNPVFAQRVLIFL